MANLLCHLRDCIAQHQLIPLRGRVLVAVSGGLDSVCLLHLLTELSRSSRCFTVAAAHLDHNLRPQSAADAEFVKQLCAEYGVDCYCHSADVAAVASLRKLGVEDAARQERRAFLQRVAAATASDCIALAHHLNDQAETVLLRMTRGCGVSGLAAMQISTPPYIRPLLPVARHDLEAYALANGLRHVEDVTNSDVRFDRNRIRHNVLPQLQQINTAAVRQIAALSQRCSIEESYWQQQVQKMMDCCCFAAGDELRLDCAVLAAEHQALRMRTIRYALQVVRGDLHGIEAGHLEMIDSLLCAAKKQKQVSLPGVWAARRYRYIVLRTAKPPRPPVINMLISGPCVVLLPNGRRLEFSCNQHAAGEHGQQVEFDRSGVDFPLQLRNAASGDKISCSGMSGRKKLKNIFSEKKIEREQRAAALVVTAADTLLWLVGMARCREYRSSAAATAVIRVVLYEENSKI